MKRIFALLLAAMMIALPALPAAAEGDEGGAAPAATEEGNQSTLSAYMINAVATTVNGDEIAVIKPGDKFNMIFQVVDYAAAASGIGSGDDPIENYLSARYNGTDYTYTGLAEVKGLELKSDANGSYYTYHLIFRNVVYNGGGNYFSVDLSYPGTTIPMSELRATVGQCVNPEEEQSTGSKPNLIIRGIDFGTDTIIAGQTFNLNVTLYASGGTANLEDVVVSLTPQSNGVSLAGGSSSSYVGSMAPGSTRTVTFAILASASFTGEGGNGIAQVHVSAGGAETTVSIPIVQPDRFELGNIELYDSLYVGQGGSVTLYFVNKGQNTVTNLEATISGTNFTADDTYLYLGNVAPGTESSVDFDIYPETGGVVAGVITLTYEYADGTTKTLSKDFSATAEEPWYPSYEEPSIFFPDVEPEPESTGLPGWGIALIVAAVVAAGVVVALVVVRKRRKTKAMASLGDENEDF